LYYQHKIRNISKTLKKLKSKESQRDTVVANMVSRKKVLENSAKNNNHPWLMITSEV